MSADGDTVREFLRAAIALGNERLAQKLAAEAQRDALAEALLRAQTQQGKTLGRLREQGVVFDKAPRLPAEDWQQIAFWIYTDLCEVESIARAALAEAGLK